MTKRQHPGDTPLRPNRIKLVRIGISLFLVGCILMGLPTLSRMQKSRLSVSKSGFYFDTIIQITLYGTDNGKLIDECFALADRYENLLSNTIPESDVSRINTHPGEYVTVSPETLEVIKAGISYGRISHGAFDITVGNVSALWNFSEISAQLETKDNEASPNVLPDAKDVSAAISHVDYTKIQLNGNQVMLADSQAKLDLGGIAKGYIADKMREYLNEQGVTAGTVNLGGNVLTLGEKENGKSYVIGIQKPFSDSGQTLGTLKVPDASIVTSGVYQRYYRINGRLYHHILDTATGYPCENDLWSVTVISSSSMDGDALSTTCFALGLTDGMALIESLDDAEAVFVTNDQKIHTSSGIGGEISFLPD